MTDSTRLRAAALFAVLLLPSACAQSDQEPAPSTPAEAAQPEAAQPEAAQPEAAQPVAAQPEAAPPQSEPVNARMQDIVLDRGELRDKDGKYVYCLDCRRKAATYTYCEFDKAEFDAVLSSVKPDSEVTLSVEMVAIKSETHVPDDPNAPQPEGGFTHDRHSCTVKSVKAD